MHLFSSHTLFPKVHWVRKYIRWFFDPVFISVDVSLATRHWPRRPWDRIHCYDWDFFVVLCQVNQQQAILKKRSLTYIFNK
jgi:hypothetical protein